MRHWRCAMNQPESDSKPGRFVMKQDQCQSHLIVLESLTCLENVMLCPGLPISMQQRTSPLEADGLRCKCAGFYPSILRCLRTLRFSQLPFCFALI
eukprot:1155150-Pelagomonas_calceolata.AAC.18